MVVDKSVTLKRIGYPVVDVGGEGDAIRLTADGITLEGFTATNSGSFWKGYAAIKVTSNNTITGSNASNNRDDIYLHSSGNNNIYLNNFIDNSRYVRSYRSYEPTNIWNSTEKMTYTYLGTTYESYLGNYWDDYEGTDADGIGNTPFNIDSEEDENEDYPLMMPFENYIR